MDRRHGMGRRHGIDRMHGSNFVGIGLDWDARTAVIFELSMQGLAGSIRACNKCNKQCCYCRQRGVELHGH